MRIVFFGSPEFAAIVLGELMPRHDVVGVVTNPDKVKSRGKKLEPTPVRMAAEAAGIPVITASTLRDADTQAQLAAFNADAFCVAACSMLLSQEILDMPRFGCLNVHGSLLPRWRGAAPIERAILAGDETTGVCIMRMELGLDTGPYCAAYETETASKSAEELTEELAHQGGRLLADVLDRLPDATWQIQSDDGAVYAEKLARGELNWNTGDTAVQAVRKARAASEGHRCKAMLAGRAVDILAASIGENERIAEGAVRAVKHGILVGFADGTVRVERVRPEGKAEMDAASFVNGTAALRAGDAAWEPIV